MFRPTTERHKTRTFNTIILILMVYSCITRVFYSEHARQKRVPVQRNGVVRSFDTGSWITASHVRPELYKSWALCEHVNSFSVSLAPLSSLTHSVSSCLLNITDLVWIIIVGKENSIIMSSLHDDNLKFSFSKYLGNFQKSLSKAVDVRSGKILIPSNNHHILANLKGIL